MYEDLYHEREAMLENWDSEGQKMSQKEIDRLNQINEVLQEAKVGEDSLVDEWEQDWEEGRTPDLDKKQEE